MDDTAFVRARIESYADYTNDDGRRLSDEQVRAYLGEALARAGERFAPVGPAGEALSQLLLRCQFADQRVIRALDAEQFSAATVTTLRRDDRSIVDFADRLDTIAPNQLADLLAQISSVFDARSGAILAHAASLPGTFE